MASIFSAFGDLPRQIVRGMIRLYYPAIEVSGREHIPAAGPVLFVANHANSLIDPVIIGIASRRPVHFLAKAPLFDTPVLGPAMKALGMLPAYRGVDDMRQVAKNTESLAAAAECLARGEAVGLFPEGKSHDELKVDQVKSGAARIASQAVQKGARGLRIVPLGLNYERKEQFRSSVWVQVGEAIKVDDWIKAGEAEDKHAMRALTQEIDRRLKAAVIHLAEGSWAPFLGDLEILAPRATARVVDPIAALRQRKRLANAVNHFMEHDRERALRMVVTINKHREALAAAGLEIRSPVVRFRSLPLFWRLVKQTGGLCFGIVPMLLGLLHHLVPFAIVRLVAPKFQAKGRSTTALTRLGFGLPVYALWYAAVWWVAARYFRPWVAWAWTLAMPFAGLFALSYCRRVRNLACDWWCQLRAVFQRNQITSLRRQQAELSSKLAQLETDFARTQPAEPALPPVSWWRRWRGALLGGGTAIALGYAALVGLRVASQPRVLPEIAHGGAALSHLNSQGLERLLAEDEVVLVEALKSLERLATQASGVKAEFDAGKRSFYRQEDDDLIHRLMLTYLSCRTELLRLIWQYQGYDQVKDETHRARAFLLALTAGASLFDYSSRLVELFADSPKAIAKLNEAEPRWSIPADLYHTVRANLNQPAHRELLRKAGADYQEFMPEFTRLQLAGRQPYDEFHQAIQSLVGKLPSLPPATGRTLLSTAIKEGGVLGKETIYLAQSVLSTWVGDTRVRQPRAGKPLIQPDHLEQVRRRLQPGDVLLERQNWFLSRAFMPGYWAHAALYVGTQQDLQQLGLYSDPRVTPHWEAFIQRDEQGHEHVILEAVPRGVRMSTLEHVLGIADSAAVLRPKLTDAQRREAIAQAFSHLNKPYDFEFDFFSADKLVCTELVYRCYDGPIHFELVNVMGRLTLPPTELVRQYAADRQHGRPQFDLVVFLDGVESLGQARFSNEKAFADTINRPSLTWLQKE